MVSLAIAKAINRIPEVPRTLGAIAFTTLLSWACVQANVSRGQKVPTLSAEWQAANADYRKFQNMDPIFG